MRKIALLFSLCAIATVASADLVIDGVDPGNNWIAWANCFNADGSWAAPAGWGSGWGLADVPATFETAGLTIKPNANTYNPTDPYWVNPDGSANKIMEMNVYFETSGLAGQNVTFNYNVLANNLLDGYDHLAFIKVLDPDADWATVQSTFADLVVGSDTLSLDVDGLLANPVVQVGFLVKGLIVDPASPEAANSVVIATIPEPATMGLLALGALLLRRRK